MIFLKCLYLVFLINGVCLSMKALIKDKHINDSWQQYLIFNILAWLAGALWIFLLLRFFKITI